MNEAETSNNEAFVESLNSANSPQLEQASCPFYAVVPHDNMAVQKLPLLQPAKDEQPETQVPEVSADATKQDWVAEPDIEKQALIDSEFQKLLTLNAELRSANNGLYEQVEKLKDDLAGAEKAVQWQKKRTSVTESMLNQQTQELAAAQEQIKSLFQQLETAVQTVQRQEIFIETYKAQLQISQQRLAQLERECSLLQTNYGEQSQQLLQSENSCRELRTRLMRQQRQTLQFKAALEKCLDTTVPGDDSLEDIANHPREKNTKQSRFSKKARSLFPNAQPIKPWSAEPEPLTDNLDSSGKESPPPAHHHRTEPAVPQSSIWDWSDRREDQPIPAKPDTSPQALPLLEASQIIEDSPTQPEVVATSGSTNIDEQIDSLIQMFFVSQPASTPSLSTIESTLETDVDSNQADDDVSVSIWETSATTIVDDEEPETKKESNPSISWVVNKTPSSANNSPVSPTSTSVTVENEDYWSEISQLNHVDLPSPNIGQDSSDEDGSDNKSPSPVVYPKRPPKGRKSLASVELPNFRQKSQ